MKRKERVRESLTNDTPNIRSPSSFHVEDVSPTGKMLFDDSDEGSTDSEMLFE